MIASPAGRPRAALRAAPGSLADLCRGELVGLRASIVRSCNPGIVGASGTVVEETRNMLVLSPNLPQIAGADRSCTGGGAGIEDSFMESNGGAGIEDSFMESNGGGDPGAARRPYRSYPKAGSVWRFAAALGRDAARDGAEIDGALIARRPEDRLRSKLPPGAASGLQAGGAGA